VGKIYKKEKILINEKTFRDLGSGYFKIRKGL